MLFVLLPSTQDNLREGIKDLRFLLGLDEELMVETVNFLMVFDEGRMRCR